MKDIKRRIIIGSALFVALWTVQTASAWYDPSTGRWLTRDPVGEPGFRLLQAAVVPPTSPASPTRWINRDPINATDESDASLDIAYGEAPWFTRDGLVQTEANLYQYVGNNPISNLDPEGLAYKSCTLLSQTCTSSKKIRIGLDVIFVCTQRKCKWRCYHDRPDNCYSIPCKDKKCPKDHGVEELKIYGPDPTKPFGAAPLCKDKEADVIASGK